MRTHAVYGFLLMMRPLTSVVTLILLFSSLTFVGSSADKKPVPPKPSKKRNLDYSGQLSAELTPDRKVTYKEVDGRELKLHLFLPEGWKATDKRPCFHIIHGGGWAGMDPGRMYPFAAEMVKRRGMVGICPEYRLYKSDKSVTVFDCVKDARSSVRYVRSHAGELGIDPGKVVVSGASAGGHLAAATALFDEVNEKGEDSAGAKSFHEQMLAAGNQSQLVINEGGAHGYLMRKKEPFDETIAEMSAFLEKLNLLAP